MDDNFIKKDLALHFTALKDIRERELKEGEDTNTEDFKLKLQEAQLVIEQLVWLINLSENIVKATKTLKTN